MERLVTVKWTNLYLRRIPFVGEYHVLVVLHAFIQTSRILETTELQIRIRVFFNRFNPDKFFWRSDLCEIQPDPLPCALIYPDIVAIIMTFIPKEKSKEWQMFHTEVWPNLFTSILKLFPEVHFCIFTCIFLANEIV